MHHKQTALEELHSVRWPAHRMQLTSTGDAPLTADEIQGLLQRIKLT